MELLFRLIVLVGASLSITMVGINFYAGRADCPPSTIGVAVLGKGLYCVQGTRQ